MEMTNGHCHGQCFCDVSVFLFAFLIIIIQSTHRANYPSVTFKLLFVDVSKFPFALLGTPVNGTCLHTCMEGYMFGALTCTLDSFGDAGWLLTPCTVVTQSTTSLDGLSPVDNTFQGTSVAMTGEMLLSVQMWKVPTTIDVFLKRSNTWIRDISLKMSNNGPMVYTDYCGFYGGSLGVSTTQVTLSLHSMSRAIFTYI